jgi:hypothetical protein
MEIVRMTVIATAMITKTLVTATRLRLSLCSDLSMTAYVERKLKAQSVCVALLEMVLAPSAVQ